MTITNNKKELWIGSGNQIVIFDLKSRFITAHLKIAKNVNLRNSLASLMCSDGVNTVWTSIWKSGYITEWDVKRRTKVYEYYCSDKSPLNTMVQFKADTFAGLQRAPSLEERNEQVTGNTHKNGGATSSMRKDDLAEASLYKRPSLQFPSRTYVRHPSSGSKMSSTQYDADITSQLEKDKVKHMFNSFVTSMRHTPGLLWMGRTCGDILIIDLVTGHVTTVLADDNLRLLGEDNRYVQSMVPMEGPDKMVACVRNRTNGGQRRSLVPAQSLENKQKESYQILVFNRFTRECLVDFNERVHQIFT